MIAGLLCVTVLVTDGPDRRLRGIGDRLLQFDHVPDDLHADARTLGRFAKLDVRAALPRNLRRGAAADRGRRDRRQFRPQRVLCRSARALMLFIALVRCFARRDAQPRDTLAKCLRPDRPSRDRSRQCPVTAAPDARRAIAIHRDQLVLLGAARTARGRAAGLERRVRRRRLDTANWQYDTARNKEGWYNGELQYYSAGRAENLRVGNGLLRIEARRETLDPAKFPDWGGQNYTSARIFSKGEGWTYGFYEIRAKLPCARGTWPAIWMLPVDLKAWPDDGEIDIMEQVGAEPNLIYASLHTLLFNHIRKTQRSAQKPVPTSCECFPCLPARLAAELDHHRRRWPGHLARSQRPAPAARARGPSITPLQDDPQSRDRRRLGRAKGHRR